MNIFIFFKKHRGFTLIELMIVLFILSIVMMAIYSLYLTHQRSAYTQDEVVEVQQNLRIGMESMTRDIRMAGFLSSTTPVTVISNGTGTLQPLPAPDNINSDSITITTASASGKVARLKQTPAGNIFYIDDPFAVDTFNTNDQVAIIRAGNKSLPAGTGPFTINATSRSAAPPTITLDSAPSGEFIAGDLIVETGGTYPNTIQYCLGPSATCGNTVTTCPPGQLCLMRIVNGTADPIAQNMAGLQFSYLMDDNTACGNPECDPPPAASYSSIRAVRVKLIGQTVKTTALSDNRAKQRRIDAVIGIRNR